MSEPETSPRPTITEVTTACHAAHNPALVNDDMVNLLWEDGEWTSEKGGGLYSRRLMHVIARAIPGVNVPMVMKENGHSYIIVSRDDAYRLRDMMSRMVGAFQPHYDGTYGW